MKKNCKVSTLPWKSNLSYFETRATQLSYPSFYYLHIDHSKPVVSPYIIFICGGATHSDSRTLIWWARGSKGIVLPPQDSRGSVCEPYDLYGLWCRRGFIKKKKKNTFCFNIATSCPQPPPKHASSSVWACGNRLLFSGLWWSRGQCLTEPDR